MKTNKGFSDKDLNKLQEYLRQMNSYQTGNEGGESLHGEVIRLIIRMKAAESALDSYDRLYHAYDDESLDEYKRWRKAAGK